MTSILHITPHLGGGIGRVLCNLIDGSHRQGQFKHQVCSLEHANEAALAWAMKSGVLLMDRMADNYARLHKKLSQTDIVQVHWWNHPLIYNFLSDPHLPEMRTAIWSHVNGHQAPQVFTKSLIEWPDVFVLATPYSLEVPCIAALPEKIRASRIKLVQSCAGIEHVKHVEPMPHQGFQIGYIGTVDYCKLHRRFVEICLKVDIPDAKFVICGDDIRGRVETDVRAAGASSRFDFRGWVGDISAALNEFDVLGYPLDGHHYGTGEQVLIEAMASGVVPVVLDSGVEKHIVKDGKTGIVVQTIEEYVAALEYLNHHPDQRKALARQARKDSLESFNIERTVDAWHAIYAEMGQHKKRLHSLRGMRDRDSQSDRAVSMYIQSLGDSRAAALYASLLNPDNDSQYRQLKSSIRDLRPIFHSHTRGSVFHYQSFFTHSPGLNRLCNIMKAGNEQGLAEA